VRVEKKKPKKKKWIKAVYEWRVKWEICIKDKIGNLFLN
jgi:hypothetical protein